MALSKLDYAPFARFCPPVLPVKYLNSLIGIPTGSAFAITLIRRLRETFMKAFSMIHTGISFTFWTGKRVFRHRYKVW